MKIIAYALSVAVAATFSVAQAAEVPDALSVEWQGKHPCEKLFEDAQVRVARCTFPPGAVHVCHAHPSYLAYVVSGGRGQIQDEKGIRKIDVMTVHRRHHDPICRRGEKVPGSPDSRSIIMPKGHGDARG